MDEYNNFLARVYHSKHLEIARHSNASFEIFIDMNISASTICFPLCSSTKMAMMLSEYGNWPNFCVKMVVIKISPMGLQL